MCGIVRRQTPFAARDFEQMVQEIPGAQHCARLDFLETPIAPRRDIDRRDFADGQVCDGVFEESADDVVLNARAALTWSDFVLVAEEGLV